MTELEKNNKYREFSKLVEKSKRQNALMIPAMIYDIFRQIERLR